MKKYIIVGLGIAVFGLVYYLTGSWKISLIAIGLAAIYLFWTIRFELGFTGFRQKQEDFEEDFKKEKKRHLKRTENNPTLR